MISHLLLLELAYLVFTNNLPFTVAVQIQKENVLWAFHHRNCNARELKEMLNSEGSELEVKEEEMPKKKKRTEGRKRIYNPSHQAILCLPRSLFADTTHLIELLHAMTCSD